MAKPIKQDKFLRYVTKRDGKVRSEHALLDFVTKKVDDQFWHIYYPPNGWGCRCRVEALQSSGITSTNTIGLNLHKSVPNIFRFNAALEETVFSRSHPYFKVAKQYKKLAQKNFNLPMFRKNEK